jgi:Flp pilus assembly protein TadG
MRARQHGITTVEFAIVAMLAFIVLFGVIEIARVFFVYNALEEATRRGARVAAVCQVNDPAIAQIASFTASGSPVVAGLGPTNIEVKYLDGSGNVLADPVASYGLITYVRVRIVDFTHRLFIPFIPTFMSSFLTPEFSTTVPAESLGVWPGGYSPC